MSTRHNNSGSGPLLLKKSSRPESYSFKPFKILDRRGFLTSETVVVGSGDACFKTVFLGRPERVY